MKVSRPKRPILRTAELLLIACGGWLVFEGAWYAAAGAIGAAIMLAELDRRLDA
ncbi:hypothetical protein OG601_47135 [Streptomyces sp. NBC_01239]|uniref:hypothetical protein n=1 Tax=Streptomyces sp. NBC_01239 TaxID=2903792 RepID=UPI0022544BA6|nr:hypothetical protein [Streptomyces sp. NBC_01239]MCX4809032.1 hypothetical protein [Streptomyces sp. NBC_01239]MCX4818150.1 hypothetical protein [Streptomyces sp. NBC_01239]